MAQLPPGWDVRLARWPGNAPAALTLTFDDGYRSTCHYALRLWEARGIPSTHYVVVGAVGGVFEGRAMASWEEWRQAAGAGLEVASHTMTHLSLPPPIWAMFRRLAGHILGNYNRVHSSERWRQILSAASGGSGSASGVSSRFAAELSQSRSILEQELAQPVFSFAYPRGWHNGAARSLVQRYGYISARSGDQGYNLWDGKDMYALKTQVWHRFTHRGDADRWVDRTVEKGAWLIETHHLVAEEDLSPYLYLTQPGALMQHLDYAAKRGMWIHTQQQVSRYLVARQHTRLRAAVEPEGRLRLSLAHGLDPARFGMPLTVHIKWPGGETLLETAADGREAVWQP